MKLLNKSIIIAVALMMAIPTFGEAQTKKGSDKSIKSETKKETKTKIKKSKTKKETKSLSKSKEINFGSKSKSKVGTTGKAKSKYQIAVDPILKGTGIATKDELKTCLKDKKMGFMEKWSYNKYKKGKSLSDKDKKRIFTLASSCTSPKTSSPPKEPKGTKKGYQNSGKTSKGATKGRVG
jgi:hypothetical protein